MVRSMYSGVSGMRVHQTAMDTIGNNIANVNTYGFKGSRTTFADIYYQSLRGASAASATRGGVNASQVGVGSQVRSVDLMMTRSSFTQTDMGMDVAVDGEGFLQVMDADGNKYYTRAGQLLFDANGNLVDSKGNFVLGTNGDPFGKDPSSDKIQVNLGNADPAKATKTETINNVEWTITAGADTEDGNVGINFMSDSTLPLNQACSAEVTDSGIIVHVNANYKFDSVNIFSSEINKAIDEAVKDKTGKDKHPAGPFTVTCSNFPAGGLTGGDLCSADYSVKSGKIEGWDSTKLAGFGFSGVGNAFLQGVNFGTPPNYNAGQTIFNVTGAVGEAHTVTLTLTDSQNATHVYTAMIPAGTEGTGKLRLIGPGGEDDYVEVTYPTAEDITATETTPGTAGAITIPATGNNSMQLTLSSSEPRKSMGLSSRSFVLEKGTKGGLQGIESLTGVSIGTDGVITGNHDLLGEVKIGRIDLATFVNPSGMSATGGTYFSTTPNSGTMSLTKPGQGGSGQVVAGSLELSNVDLSREFTDMIKTQRGYQANSRIITVSDTMLEELVNLKR